MRPHRIFSGTGLRFAALLIAAAIWAGVSSERREQTIERAFDVPIALVNVPRDAVVVTPIPEGVSVQLRGPVSALRSLSSQNLEVTLDMHDLKPSSVKITIRPQALNVPDNVEVVSISPATLSFKLEARRYKRVPVRPFLVGTLPPGYTYDPQLVTAVPKSALVSGPSSSIRQFDAVFTDRVILSGRTASFQQTVGVVSDAPLVRVIDPQSATVEVIVIPPAAEPSEAVPAPAPPVKKGEKKPKGAKK